MASDPNPIKKIDPNSTSPLQPAQPGGPSGGLSEGSLSSPAFRNFMGDSGQPMKGQISNTPGISPLELANEQRVLGTPTLDSLASQMSTSQATMKDIRSSLNDPNLKLKKSQQYLMRNKLEDANTHLQSANAKLGGTVPTPTEVPPGASPTERFLAYVTDGERQMQAAQNKLGQLTSSNPGEVNSGDYLLLQVKLSQAQQELNYVSILLSNAISGIRQVMQIQI